MIPADDPLREFLAEAGEHLDAVAAALVRLERDPRDGEVLRKVFRLIHSLKGTCGFLGLSRLETLTHAAETLMGRLRDGAPVTAGTVTLIFSVLDRIKLIVAETDRLGAEPEGLDADLVARLRDATRDAAAPGGGSRTPAPKAVPVASEPPAPTPLAGSVRTVRVRTATLDRLAASVSELALVRDRLLDVARAADASPQMSLALQRLSRITSELQDGSLQTRMQPLGAAWMKLPRLVRDLADELGKKIELVITGEETEVDREILDLLRDPLLHMIRNAADHGIEDPKTRRAAGKAETGTIRLDARREGGVAIVELSDDGRGLDIPAIRRRAVALGFGSEAEIARQGDEEAAGLIFRAGLSTSPGAHPVSGRGVGMDVVHTNIDEIGGSVTTASRRGLGATFRICVPASLKAQTSPPASIRPPRPQNVAAREGAPPPAGFTILLAQGDPSLRGMLRGALKAAGYRVLSAVTADEALRLALGGTVGVLVTDIDLPDRSGLDLAEAVQRHFGRDAVPTIVLANSLDAERRGRTQSLAVRAVLPGFDAAGLLAALKAEPAAESIAA